MTRVCRVLVLVTGGVRSGKSRHAESLLAAEPSVTYVAPGPLVDDPDWAARIAAHRSRRPQGWTTVEGSDLAGALNRAEGPVMVDCLGTWLTALCDEAELWDEPTEAVTEHVERALADIERALQERTQVVFVTNEVGLGVVPEHRAGRLFRDLLGLVNQRIAARCDEVHLVIAGRVLVL